jgi:tetratricopeptide (TPR) repeat protein
MSSSLLIEPREFRRSWETADLHGEIRGYRLPPAEIHVQQGAILTRSRFLSSEEARGGIYTSSGEYLPCSDHRRRGKVLAPSNPAFLEPNGNPPVLPGRHIYLGWFFNHYGHFMLESLARCWPLLKTHDYDGYIFHLHIRAAEPARRLFEFFDLLKIPRERLVFVTEDLRVEELHIPSQQGVLSRALGPEILRLYQRLGQAAWERLERPQHNPRLYISRRLLASNMRHACNEYLLERHFRKQGYSILHPQLLKPTEQLARFHVCTHLAGLEGSGLHNVLFARQPEETWMLCSRQRMPDAITQALLDGCRGSRTRILFQETGESPALASETTSFLISGSSLEELGLTKAPHDPWSEFGWIRSLAGQIEERTESMNEVIGDLGLSSSQAATLDCLLHPDEPLPRQLLTDHKGKLLRAMRLGKQGDAASACARMAECLPACGDNPGFLLAYATMLRMAGQTEEARQVADRARRLDPGNPRMELLLAEILAETGDPAGATEILRASLASHPLHFPSLVRLADLLAREEKYTKAAHLLREALALRPGNGGLYPRLTWYLMQKGDWPAARDAALRALELQPGNPHSHAHLGRIYLALDKPLEALPHMDEAIRRSPENAGHYRLRARLYRLLGDEQAALLDEQRAE